MDHHPFNQPSCGMERLSARSPSKSLNQPRQRVAVSLPKIGHQPHGARRRREQLLLKSRLLGRQAVPPRREFLGKEGSKLRVHHLTGQDIQHPRFKPRPLSCQPGQARPLRRPVEGEDVVL
jgi:hypothetical protein